MKGRLNITADNELIEEAKRKKLNISAVTERALREATNKQEIKSPDKCFKCLRELEKATAQNPDIGLCWLDNAQDWICHICLRSEINKVTFAQ